MMILDASMHHLTLPAKSKDEAKERVRRGQGEGEGEARTRRRGMTRRIRGVDEKRR